jgi:hypothetical protein
MSQIKAMVNKLLTNVSNGYFPQGYISELVLPTLTVKQKTGIIGAYGQSHIRIVDDLIGGEAQARRVIPISRKVDNTYIIQSHALEGVVTQDDYDNVEQPFDAEKDETQGLTHLIWTNKERALASSLFSTSVMTQNATLAGTDQWSDYANSKPTEDFKDAHNAILDGCGMQPNAAVMSRKVFNTLIYHPQILDSLGYAMNRAGTLSEAEVAKAMGIDKLYIGSVAYNSAKDGQTDVLAQIWGKSCLFFVRPDAPSKQQISLGYYMKQSSSAARQVYKYDLNNPPGSQGIIVQDDYSFELVNVKAAYLYDAAIA